MSRLAALVVLALGAASAAHADCGAQPACTFADIAACCGATSCNIAGVLTISAATCDLDFGGRNVTVTSSGQIVVGSKTLTIEAGSLHLQGDLVARGAAGQPGGSIGIRLTGASATFTQDATTASIDVSGSSAGSISIDADGAVSVSAGTVIADGLDAQSNGGLITLRSRNATVSLSMPFSADSGGQNGGRGAGGFIRVRSGTDITISSQLTANGGLGNGEIDLTADGMLTLTAASNLQVNGVDKGGGDGGDVRIKAAAVSALGVIQADGGSDPVNSQGGNGGNVSLEATSGRLLAMHSVRGISVGGAVGGSGGEITLQTDTPASLPETPASLTVAAPLSATGAGNTVGANFAIGGGGFVTLDASSGGSIEVKPGGSIDASGVGEGTGTVAIEALRDVTLNDTVKSTDPEGGGDFTIDAHRDVRLNADIRMQATRGSGSNGGGGITVSADRDLLIGGGATLDVSGVNQGDGGTFELKASRNLLVSAGVLLNGNGGGSGGRAADVSLNAGCRPASQGCTPELSGDLTILGVVSANGTSNIARPSGPVALGGCNVSVPQGGRVDSSGEPAATNALVGRKKVTVAGVLKSTPQTGFNTATHPTGAGNLMITGQVTPALMATPQALCSLASSPPGCLIPCPQCGDGSVDYPEECEIHPGDDRCTPRADLGPGVHCDSHCRMENCSDGLSCTTDECDPAGGCLNRDLPDGTPCDDGDDCTTGDVCASRLCTGTPIHCDTCFICGQGLCVFDNGPGKRACDDGNFCNGDEVCASGQCNPGPPPSCHEVPDDPTTRDFCDKNACQHVPNGCQVDGDCDDRNGCTTDTCVGGVCHNDPLPNTTACDGGGDACVGLKTCVGGICHQAPGLDCSNPPPCQTGRCDAAGGHCVFTPIPSCCQTVADCDDANGCTTDTCPADHQCLHVPVSECCSQDSDCDKACNVDNKCVGSQCTHNPAPLEGTSCGDVCHPATCQSGTCVAGNPLVCQDDGEPCTDDFCDAVANPATGCVHPAIAGCCHVDADCNDHDACTADACNQAHQCTNDLDPTCVPCSADTDCDPLGRCGGKACAQGGTCVTSAVPDCDDHDLNTHDACAVVGGVATCQHQCLNAQPCDDGDACTRDSCTSGACAHDPIAGCCHAIADCDDHDTCTADTCNGAAGCAHRPIDNCCHTSADCDDADGCTLDSCTAGQCQHGERTGFAGVSCRLDAADAALGAAAPTDIKKAIAHKLMKKAKLVRSKLALAIAADSAGNKKRKAKTRAILGKGLGGLVNLARHGQRAGTIRDPLSGTLIRLYSGAASAVTAVRSGGAS